MQYDDLPESGNVEDRRGQGGGLGGGGGGFGMPTGAGGLGIGTIVVLGLLGWALGIDPSLLIGGAEIFTRKEPQVQTPTQPTQPGRTGTPSDETGRFVSRILGSTEAVWRDVLTKSGDRYRAPVLVLFNGQTRAPCGGVAQSAMGPFYCPVDTKIYLDTSFFQQIETRFRGCSGRSCQFSQAYVIAHEVGHHVQNLLGILTKATNAERAAGGRAAANAIQVQVELQADCFAGLWAKHENDKLISEGKRAMIEPGDVEAALQTAAAIGDDTLQKKSQGYAVPDSFTHGTSAQRQRWFDTGFKTGTIAGCNTFGASQL
jgi:uncharacterized protein